MSRDEHPDHELPSSPLDRYVLLGRWRRHLESIGDPRADDVGEEMDEIHFDFLTDDEVMAARAEIQR